MGDSATDETLHERNQPMTALFNNESQIQLLDCLSACKTRCSLLRRTDSNIIKESCTRKKIQIKLLVSLSSCQTPWALTNYVGMGRSHNPGVLSLVIYQHGSRPNPSGRNELYRKRLPAARLDNILYPIPPSATPDGPRFYQISFPSFCLFGR